MTPNAQYPTGSERQRVSNCRFNCIIEYHDLQQTRQNGLCLGQTTPKIPESQDWLVRFKGDLAVA